MDGRLRCPVCDVQTARDAYPEHLADAHLGRDIRDRYAYSAVWAGVLVVLAAATLALQASVLTGTGRVRRWLTALGGPWTLHESAFTVVVWLVVPLAVLAIAWTTVAVARGPGQSLRRGYRPSRKEYAYVLLLPVTGIGPLCYLVGALRRFVGVRYAREKTVVAFVPASERFEQAERALAADRPSEALAAFEDVDDRLSLLRDDRHFANPELERRVAALQRACGLAAAVCERRASDDAASEDAPTTA